jgi:hypothetical protein
VRPGNGEFSSSTDRFSLDGPSIVLDPRIHAWRKDIADVGLAGRLFAPHYARPLIRDCGLLPTPMRREPLDTADAVSELLPGEKFAVLDITSGWAWGYSVLDHRVGYVEAIELADPLEPTHIVIEAGAPIQSCGDPLSPPLATMPMGSRVHGEAHGAMLHTEAGCMPLAYLRRIDEHDDDPVAVAQRLLGTPYAAGGRSTHGIDCAGLVQLSLQLCGIECPRDTDLQRQLGTEIAEDAPLHRGDLLFCGDHVAMMVDDQMAIQMSPVTCKVAVEPFRAARPEGSLDRIERRRLAL